MNSNNRFCTLKSCRHLIYAHVRSVTYCRDGVAFNVFIMEFIIMVKKVTDT